MGRKWLGSLLLAGTAALAAACGGGNNGGDGGGGEDTAPADTGGNNEAAVDTGGGGEDVVGVDAVDQVSPPDTGIDVNVPPDDVPDVQTPPPVQRHTQTNGSAVAVTSTGAVAVMANRTAGTVSVFTINTAASTPLVRTANLDVGGPSSEPWEVVISNDDAVAYVVLRGTHKVQRIDGITATPTLGPAVDVGAEPTGIAITPSGAKLFVANWSEGTVSVISTASMSVTRTVDLNAALAGSGLLGPSVTAAAARPGLAHPRDIVVTTDGDTNDGNEHAYVTEFFAQQRTAGLAGDDSDFDLNKQGVVYRFDVLSYTVDAPITLAPVADTGFADSNGSQTGCFPNELYAAAENSGRIYVTAVCESPRGPIGPVGSPVNPANFKTEVHAGVFVIDEASGAELPAQAVLLPRAFTAMYDAAVPAIAGNDPARRLPLIVNDIAFVPGSSIAYLSSYGTDAVFRVQYNADGTVARVGSPVANFIDLNPAGAAVPGTLPVGVFPLPDASHLLTANENSRSASLIALASQSVQSAAQAADPPAAGNETTVNDGRRFFVTGLTRWSLNGQGWNSCESCHPDGLTDNTTWFFARGPRQTVSLDGTFSPDGTQQRFLNWTAILDEVQDFELNTRGNSGGVGAIVHTNSTPPVGGDRIIFDGTTPVPPQRATQAPQAGLNGSTEQLITTGVPEAVTGANLVSVNKAFNALRDYVKTIQAPDAPVSLPPTNADVIAGRQIFIDNNCAGCHGGPDWTLSRRFYNPDAAVNAMLKTSTYTVPTGFGTLNPPAMAGPATLRFSGTNPGANDQINCILRNVGTFPGSGSAGVVATGSDVRIAEVRPDAASNTMTTPGQGATGFNPPSLFGMVTGAPYFHAGNARTLEEVFDPAFRAHYQAFSANFLDVGDRAAQVRQLVAFLLSVQEDTAPVTNLRGTLTFDPDVCPNTFP